jgi:hypothetical protein
MNIAPKEENMLVKMSAKAGIMMNTITDSTSSHIAEMVIEGLSMGIVDTTKRIREAEKNGCDEKVLKIGHELISFQEKSVDEMKKFLSQEVKLSGIVEYLDTDECKKIREWLNDAVHLNHYKSILLNNGLLCIDKQRKIALDNFRDAFDKTIMFHVTCVFCMNPMYLMSSDYSDYIACGMEPPVDCQYDVAPFIQAYLDKTIYPAFPDWIAKLVEVASPMRLRKFEGS